uniref:Uncharacterized protein n=1 Tax=Geospiza parvula TaxID=87175 RepID=A0A8C3NDF3_GEOPR
MPWPHPAVPSPTLALAGWCPLSPTGAQTTQLLVEPPWRPAVLWDRVTLTCQGSGTAGATTWYKDGQRWKQEGQHHLTVTESGTYTCDRPGTGQQPPCDNPLVLQVPARALLEGDTVTLRCRCQQDNHLTRVRFYQDEKDLGGSLKGTELSLSPLQLHHSGRYGCEGWVGSQQPQSPLPIGLRGPPEPTQGSPLTLSCLSTPSPLRPRAPLLHVFYRDGQVVGGPQGSLQLLVPAVGVSHSGNYHCEVHSEGGFVRKSSARLRITVHRVPPSGVSVSVQPPGGQVALGDSLVLSCTVDRATGPLSFSWHWEGLGAPLGTGPRLDLHHAGDNDSGQYRCRVSDGDSMDESDPLNVTVLGERDTRAGGDPTHGTPIPPHPVPALSLCPHSARSNRKGEWGAQTTLSHFSPTPKTSHSLPHIPFIPSGPPPDPPAPPEEGEVLYTHVVVTKEGRGECGGTRQRDTAPTGVTPTQIPQPVSLAGPPSPCHHPPGSPGDLRGAAGTPGAPTGNPVTSIPGLCCDTGGELGGTGGPHPWAPTRVCAATKTAPLPPRGGTKIPKG